MIHVPEHSWDVIILVYSDDETIADVEDRITNFKTEERKSPGFCYPCKMLLNTPQDIIPPLKKMAIAMLTLFMPGNQSNNSLKECSSTPDPTAPYLP